MSQTPLATTAPEQPQFEMIASRQLTSWLVEQRVSLAFTTYQTGKLFLIGLQPDGRLSVFERTFNLVHWLWFQGIVRELYELVILLGARQPVAVGFQDNEIERLLLFGEPSDL